MVATSYELAHPETRGGVVGWEKRGEAEGTKEQRLSPGCDEAPTTQHLPCLHLWGEGKDTGWLHSLQWLL